MADLRAQDIFIIAVSLVIVVCVRAAYAYRAEIGMIAASLWRRYIAIDDWRAAMDRLADQQSRVKSYEDQSEPYSGTGAVLSGIEPSIPPPVLSHQDAENTGTWIPVQEDLPRMALLDILARQKVDNKYVFSGNKLVELFAGSPHAASRNVILDEVAKIRRGDGPEPVSRPAQRLERPANGWGKAS
jgi:hypothetical protein